MRISHPQTEYQGIVPENVFFVTDDRHVQTGTGYVVRFMQEELYPERPLHLFLQIDTQPAARALMFGALLARADQLRAENPERQARLYTQVDPNNQELLQFYEKCGLKNDDGEDRYRFPLPTARLQPPMGMQFNTVPLMDEMSRDQFLNRLNRYRIAPFTRDYLTLWQQHPHFMAMGFYRDGRPVCETVITGGGDTATLLMIYTDAQYRRQGMASQLLSCASAYLKEQGVQSMYTHIFRRNAAQNGLMRHLGAALMGTVTAMPGMDM